MLLRESVPRQVDKKKSTRRKGSAVLNEELGVKGSGVLNEDLGVWNSQGEGNDKLLFFLSAFLSFSQIKVLFCFVLFSSSLELMIIQLSLNSVLGII